MTADSHSVCPLEFAASASLSLMWMASALIVGASVSIMASSEHGAGADVLVACAQTDL